jgi:DNA modification methylase
MRAVEIAPEYVDVAIKRFQQNHPDIPVTLLGSGNTFEIVGTERQLRPRTGVTNEIV